MAAPPKLAFDFTGEVAIVTGAGSRMAGMLSETMFNVSISRKSDLVMRSLQAKLETDEEQQFY